MADDISTNDTPDEAITPAEDPILASLEDTEDTTEVEADEKPSEEAEVVDETPDETESEAEGKPEPEQEEEDGELPPDPKEEARKRYEERQRAIAERESRVREQTEDYVSQGEDEYDQRLRAMEVQQYSNLIANNEQKLITEFERVKANPELSIFNPDSPEFSERVYNKALQDYNAGYVSYDTNGNMVEVKSSLYDHLTETAELLRGATQQGQFQQVKATKTMRNRADSKPAAPPKETQKDPILDVLSAD